MNLPKPQSAWRGERLFILLMLLPAMALLFAFTIAPFVISVWLSLTDYLLSRPPARFIGLANYVGLFTSSAFWSAFWISVVFTTLTTLAETAIGVAIATLLAGTKRMASVLRTIYMLPLAVTPIAIIFTFRMMFNPGLGIINYLFRLMGFWPQDWLGNSTLAMISLVTVDIWQWTPLTILIVAGGLAALPSEPLEAARIDGATSWQSFRYVTLPMLVPFVALAVLFRAVDAFKTFDLIYILTGGGPGTSTTTLNVLAFKQAIEFTELGRGSATAIIVMIIITVASQIFLRRSKLLTAPEAGA